VSTEVVSDGERCADVQEVDVALELGEVEQEDLSGAVLPLVLQLLISLDGSAPSPLITVRDSLVDLPLVRLEPRVVRHHEHLTGQLLGVSLRPGLVLERGEGDEGRHIQVAALSIAERVREISLHGLEEIARGVDRDVPRVQIVDAKGLGVDVSKA
jgi:hypothetical protein